MISSLRFATVLVFLFGISNVKAICDDVNSVIYIYQSGFPSEQYQENDNQCLANYTVISASIIDGSASKGVTCSRKDSTATDGTWTRDGDVAAVDCSTNTGNVRCTRQSGSVTLFTAGPYDSKGDDEAVPEGTYTCCIEGLCISIRLWHFATISSKYPYGNQADNIKLESCTIIPPSDITAIPQQYMVQMVTSVGPPSRYSSFIHCTNNNICGNGVTLGKSYYTLINLTAERYQFTRPVTWSADSSSLTMHSYMCRIRFGGLSDDGSGFFVVGIKQFATASSSNAPTDVNFETVNATAVHISWSITGNVSGFVIKITNNGMNTVTEQLTDSSVREFVVNGLLSEVNYNFEVRGYNELLGPATTTTVRLEAGISSVNGSLLSVSNDLSNQLIQVNCYTFRVKPNQVSWKIGSKLITPDSSYQPVNGSELLDSVDQTYRHFITLDGSFSTDTTISCDSNVNGIENSQIYQLKAPSFPSGLSANTIPSTTSLSISWMSVSGAVGYIVDYNGGKAELIEGEDSTDHVLNGLIKGTTYQIKVYSYSRLFSVSSNLTVDFDVPSITHFEAHSSSNSRIMLSWTVLAISIIENYTVTVTYLCENIVLPGVSGDLIELSINASNGFEYSVSMVPINTLGEGMAKTDNVTIQGNDPPSGASLLQIPVTINSTAVRLSWEELSCTERNGVITGYFIQYSSEGGVQSGNVTVTDITSTVITGLTKFTLYSISVAAINNYGVGPHSNGHIIYTVNTKVLTLSLTSSIHFVLLSWQLPMNNGTNVVFQYEVAYSECFNDTTLLHGYTIYSPRTTNSSIEVFGLTSDTCYVFGVRAYPILSNVSYGEFSIINGVTISEIVPNISLSDLQSTTVTLSWFPLTTETDDNFIYQVGYTPRPDDTQCTDSNIDTLPDGYTLFYNTTDTSIVVTDLESRTCYVIGVRVYSLKSNKVGEWTTLLLRTRTLEESSSSNVGAIAGGVTVGLTLIIIVIVVAISAIIRSRQFSESANLIKFCNYGHKSEATFFDFKQDCTYTDVNRAVETTINLAYDSIDNFKPPSNPGNHEYDTIDKLHDATNVSQMIPKELPMPVGKYGPEYDTIDYPHD